MTSQKTRIGVLGHFADANHGDDACPRALLNNLSAIVPDASFVLFCLFPKDATDRFGLPAYPVHLCPDRRPARTAPRAEDSAEGNSAAAGKTGFRGALKTIPGLRPGVRFLRRLLGLARILPSEARHILSSWRHLRRLDLLVVTGSNPIFDYFGGYWNYPYTMWKWTTLARMARCKIALASVGAGPIVSAHSGKLLRRVLDKADLVSFRDRRSLDLMRGHGYRGRAEVYPDLAMSLPVPEAPGRDLSVIRVGINPMPVHHRDYWPENEASVQDKYVESLAALALHLGRAGHEVFFYGTQADDRVTAEQVQEALRRADPAAAAPAFEMPDSIDSLARLCVGSDLLVTTRYHGAVFGSLTARPTLAICYQGKTREVMEAAGLDDFAVDFEAVTAPLLIEKADLLLREASRVRESQERNALRAREALDELYAHLAELSRSTSRTDTSTWNREAVSGKTGSG